MKAVLEFSLPDEQESFEAASKGLINKAKIDTLYDIVFRPYLKYGKAIDLSYEELSEDEYHVIYTIWQEVQEHFSEEQ